MVCDYDNKICRSKIQRCMGKTKSHIIQIKFNRGMHVCLWFSIFISHKYSFSTVYIIFIEICIQIDLSKSTTKLLSDLKILMSYITMNYCFIRTMKLLLFLLRTKSNARSTFSSCFFSYRWVRYQISVNSFKFITERFKFDEVDKFNCNIHPLYLYLHDNSDDKYSTGNTRVCI